MCCKEKIYEKNIFYSDVRRVIHNIMRTSFTILIHKNVIVLVKDRRHLNVTTSLLHMAAKKMARKTTKKVAKKATKKVVKKAAKKATKKVAKKAAKKTVKKTVKKATKKVAKKAAKKTSRR